MTEISFSGLSPSDVERQLMGIVAREAMVDVSSVTLDTPLEELSIQSADFVMILMDIEEKFGLYLSVDNEMASVRTVRDFVQVITDALKQQQLEKSNQARIS